METNDLIKALAADAGQPVRPLAPTWRIAAIFAVIVAATVFVATLGPRPDFLTAAQTLRFLFKFVFTLTLAVTAFGVARVLSRPGASLHRMAPPLLAAPLLLASAVLVELLVLPADVWATRLIGSNARLCLTFIPLIGFGPLAIFLTVMRRAAPTNPTLAGAISGLLAGGIAATLYAAHCTDDSPLFVAFWYTLAIAILTLLGTVAGTRVARW